MTYRVAKILVDLPLPHLDKLFDYLIPENMVCRPGIRVKVKFAGRLVDGYLIEVYETAELSRSLATIQRIVSNQVVLPPELFELAQAVAKHYCGMAIDVLRLAIPKRVAAVEKTEIKAVPSITGFESGSVLARYPRGAGYLTALRTGKIVRGVWTAVPVAEDIGDLSQGIFDAVAATLLANQAALVIVPTQKDLEWYQEAATSRFGPGVLTLSSELSPAMRYRNYLAALSGKAKIVIGTMGAVFTPMPNLGLLVVLEEANDQYAERRAPYWHLREVAALRSYLAPVSLLYASYSRCCETQHLVEKGWLGEIAMSAYEARRLSPVVRIAADSDHALDRDPYAFVARLPHDVFTVIRAGLARGPVLVQVPRAGYLIETESGLRVGVKRTAEELGKAFPRTKVVVSSGEKSVAKVDNSPALVVCTPGMHPRVTGGYAAAVILDVSASLSRLDLRTGEESLLRWLEVAAQVTSAENEGTVMLVGELSSPTIQAMVRLDPISYAKRELVDREIAGYPPLQKMLRLTGAGEALTEIKAELAETELAKYLKWDLAVSLENGMTMISLRCAPKVQQELVQKIRDIQSRRSAKRKSLVKCEVDPAKIT